MLSRSTIFRVEINAAGLDLRHVENVVDDVEQILAALADVARIFGVFRRAERPEHRRFHDLGEADDGVERGAQLMAHVGQELRLGLVGVFGAGLFLRVFFREVGERAGLALQLLLRMAQVVDGRDATFLALDQLLLVQLDLGDIRADGNVTAILGAAFADVHPAAVVELRFEGARPLRLAVFVDAGGADDRLLARGHDGFIGAPAITASSGRRCSSWKFELQSTRRLSASHKTKASGMVSMASRSRRSAAVVFSTRFFCSDTSTAMPMRWSPASPSCRVNSQRTRSHSQRPLAWRMRKA